MEVKINTEYIKLDSFLKWANIVSTGGQAKILIQEGKVKVNGEVETKRSRKIFPGDEVEVEGNRYIVKGGSE
ncbi:MAG: S4 domain-containing protein YaaA [Thermovenabulum sp.]|uniref:S4 domain-containing protein YaaA n=1 Tax=Thermovenabulum sp. TaxID=3100335 RepID=UPI003C7AAD55